METDRPLGERIGSGRAAEVFALGEGRIVKLLREPNHRDRLEREAAAQAAARAAGVAAPEVFGVEDFAGTPGLIMGRIDGLDGLTLVDRKPWNVWTVGRKTGQLHRRLSEVLAPESLPSLKEVIRERVANSPRVPDRARSRVLRVLDSCPEGKTLCHMDFHPGNVIFAPTGPVVIDFANAARGDPLADHARSIIIFRAGEPADDTPRRERMLIAAGRGIAGRGYRSGYGRADGGRLKRWLPPVIAWRLDEGVPQERRKLLKMLGRALKQTES